MSVEDLELRKIKVKMMLPSSNDEKKSSSEKDDLTSSNYKEKKSPLKLNSIRKSCSKIINEQEKPATKKSKKKNYESDVTSEESDEDENDYEPPLNEEGSDYEPPLNEEGSDYELSLNGDESEFEPSPKITIDELIKKYSIKKCYILLKNIMQFFPLKDWKDSSVCLRNYKTRNSFPREIFKKSDRCSICLEIRRGKDVWHSQTESIKPPNILVPLKWAWLSLSIRSNPYAKPQVSYKSIFF